MDESGANTMDRGAEAYRRFLAGDEDGFTEVVRIYGAGLIDFLSGMLGRREPAEDAAQETFARLWLKRPLYRDRASFKTWLFTVGRRAALDQLRKTRREKPAESLPLPDAPDPAEDLNREMTRQAVRAALLTLPPEQRMALTLTYYEGLSNKQTAKVLGKSVHAVENLISRGRRNLKQALTREGIDHEDL